MSVQHDPGQAAAIASDARDLVVSASAGSGKTTVLVARYLRYVREGIDPESILTITFTRRAAAEMKARIVRALLADGRTEEAQAAETGPIQTLHGFCERLLRENALAAGLDPAFELLDEGRAGQALDRALRDAVADAAERFPAVRRLAQQHAGETIYGTTDPYGLLRAAAKSIVGQMRSSGVGYDAFAEGHADPATVVARWRAAALAEIPDEVARIVSVHAEDFCGAIEQAWKQVYGKGLPKWLRAPEGNPEPRDAEFAFALAQVALGAWWRLEAEQDRSQRLDFAALEARACRLVQESAEVAERLRAQYLRALVDEAQDLNPVQYTLLRAMDLPSEVLVGDHQQSIYAFRYADVRLFQERQTQAQNLRLERNYRSAPGILEGVDRIFSTLWPDRYLPMALPRGFDDPDPGFAGIDIWEHPNDHVLDTAAAVRDLVAGGVAPREIAILYRTDSRGFVKNLLLALRQAGVPARVAGGHERFYTRLEVRDVANALRAVSEPWNDYALLALLRSPMVALSLDAFALLAQRRPVGLSLASFESPVEADRILLQRFREWFEPLAQVGDRIPAWEVLGRLMADSPLLENLARTHDAQQRLMNVRKLLRMAADRPELRAREFAAQIREIQRLDHRENEAEIAEEDANEVLITTVHKSKGLEWPVVVLAQTEGSPSRDPLSKVEIDARAALFCLQGQPHSYIVQLLKQRRQSRDHEESLRLLYVALTRAKQRLCVVVPRTAKSPSWASDLRKALNLDHGGLPGLAIRVPMPRVDSQP